MKDPSRCERVDVAPLVLACRNAGVSLYGFVLSASLNAQEGRTKYLFSNTFLPEFSYNLLNTMTSSLYSNAISTVKYIYDDYHNTVTQIKRLNNDPGNLKQIVSRVQLNTNGQPISHYSLEGGIFIKRDSVVYNALGHKIYQEDALGRKVHFTSTVLGEPLTVSYGNTPETDPKKVFDYTVSGNDLLTNAFDEENNLTRIYTTSLGVKRKSISYTETDARGPAETEYFYDNLQRLTSVQSPMGKLTEYEYDLFGNIYKKRNPDQAEKRFYYNKFGQLRFMANTSVDNREVPLIYTGYDLLNRILYKGTISMTVNDEAHIDADEKLRIEESNDGKPDTARLLTVNMYDTWDETGVFSALLNQTTIPLSPMYKNFKGKLIATAFRDKPGEPWSYKIYFYDPLGRVAYMKIFPAGINNPKWVKTRYNNLGQITDEKIYPNGSSEIESFYYWYEYDDLGRLKNVLSSANPYRTTARPDLSYTYNNAGQVGAVIYTAVGNESFIQENTYNNRGWLNSISSGAFHQAINYFNNGNISSNTSTHNNINWNAFSASYTYDGLNRLTGAQITGETPEVYSYDLDGNFTQKTGHGKNLVYNYINGSNKLSSINTDANSMSTAVNYDDDGNVVSYDLRRISNIEYDHRNLPLSITGNNGTSTYGYDDAGNRIFKQQNGKKEFYLRSSAGRELGIYEYDNDGRDNLKTVNLYGAGLIGRIDVRYVPYTYTDPETHDTINTIRRNDERFYYINDHLGSVRAIVDSSGTTVFAQDTYPFGDIYRTLYRPEIGLQEKEPKDVNQRSILSGRI